MMKALVMEQSDKQVEKSDRAIQDLRDQQSKDTNEVRCLLLKLKTKSQTSATPTIRAVKDNGHSRVLQPKLTRVEFPKLNDKELNEQFYKCEQCLEHDENNLTR